MLKLVRCHLSLDHWARVMNRVTSVAVDVTAYHTWDGTPGATCKGFYRGLEYEMPVPGVILEIIAEANHLSDVVRAIGREPMDPPFSGRDIQVFQITEGSSR